MSTENPLQIKYRDIWHLVKNGMTKEAYNGLLLEPYIRMRVDEFMAEVGAPPVTHNHNTILFEGNKGFLIEECAECRKQRWLGICGDGCKMCQGCYHKEHGLAPLPSDSMS